MAPKLESNAADIILHTYAIRHRIGEALGEREGNANTEGVCKPMKATHLKKSPKEGMTEPITHERNQMAIMTPSQVPQPMTVCECACLLPRMMRE